MKSIDIARKSYNCLKDLSYRPTTETPLASVQAALDMSEAIKLDESKNERRAQSR